MACEQREAEMDRETEKQRQVCNGDGLGEFLGELTEQLGQDRKDVLRSGRRAAVGAMMAFDARDLDVLRRASCG